jgi:hypothetical protein
MPHSSHPPLDNVQALRYLDDIKSKRTEGDTMNGTKGSILIEWDGGWTTVDGTEEAEAFIAAKLAEWGDGDRDEFTVSDNTPA